MTNLSADPRPLRGPARLPPPLVPLLRRVALLAIQGSDLARQQGLDEQALDARQAEASARLAEGRTAEAVAELSWLVMQRPTEARYQFTLARALQQAGRPAEAAQQFALGLLFDPEDGWAALHWGECLDALGQRDEAVQAWRACLALSARATQGGELRRRVQARLDAADSR